MSFIFCSSASMNLRMRDSILLATLRCLISCVRRVISMRCWSTADLVSGSMARLETVLVTS